MLVSGQMIPVYPGLGLKLGSRRGISADFISGEGVIESGWRLRMGGPMLRMGGSLDFLPSALVSISARRFAPWPLCTRKLKC